MPSWNLPKLQYFNPSSSLSTLSNPSKTLPTPSALSTLCYILINWRPKLEVSLSSWQNSNRHCEFSHRALLSSAADQGLVYKRGTSTSQESFGYQWLWLKFLKLNSIQAWPMSGPQPEKISKYFCSRNVCFKNYLIMRARKG